MKRLFFFLVMIGAVWTFYNSPGQVVLGAGVMASETPQQKNISAPVSYRVDDYSIKELATFTIKAKVLSRKNYHIGREADLSPVDLALGWGNMSDEAVLEHIGISQSNRFYYWRVDAFPIPRREIEMSSANIFDSIMIPGTIHLKSTVQVQSGLITYLFLFLWQCKLCEMLLT